MVVRVTVEVTVPAGAVTVLVTVTGSVVVAVWVAVTVAVVATEVTVAVTVDRAVVVAVVVVTVVVSMTGSLGRVPETAIVLPEASCRSTLMRLSFAPPVSGEAGRVRVPVWLGCAFRLNHLCSLLPLSVLVSWVAPCRKPESLAVEGLTEYVVDVVIEIWNFATDTGLWTVIVMTLSLRAKSTVAWAAWPWISGAAASRSMSMPAEAAAILNSGA